MREPDAARRETEGRLNLLRRLQGGCTRCGLHRGRTATVGGVGHANADLMFVGEAPGPEEDRLGEAFTGRSGKLLDRIIEAMGSARSRVYLTNAAACALDEGRDIRSEHIEACRPHLKEEIDAVNPAVIVALGATAWQWFKGTDKRKMADIRGKLHRWGPRLVLPTYHPAFLLRKPQFKRDVWTDVQLAARIIDQPETIAEIEVHDLDTAANAAQQTLFG